MQAQTDFYPVCLADIVFGSNGNSRPNVLEGWSDPEDGFTWSLGARSALNIGLPASPGPYWQTCLELQLNPFIVPDHLDGQRLAVRVNGSLICEQYLRAECTVLYPLPVHCLAHPPVGGVKRLLVQFLHPDFARPCDYGVNEDERKLALMLRRLRVYARPPLPLVDITVLPPLQLPLQADRLDHWIRAVTGQSSAALRAVFEIVHDREAASPSGAEPASPVDFDTLRALAPARLEAARAAADAGPQPENGDRQEVEYFYRRLQAGDKIFVVQRTGAISLPEARALHQLLQYGRPNALLFLDEDPILPEGAVEQIEYGLFHGKLNTPVDQASFWPSVVGGAWTSLCVNTYRLWSQRRQPSAP